MEMFTTTKKPTALYLKTQIFDELTKVGIECFRFFAGKLYLIQLACHFLTMPAVLGTFRKQDKPVYKSFIFQNISKTTNVFKNREHNLFKLYQVLVIKKNHRDI